MPLTTGPMPAVLETGGSPTSSLVSGMNPGARDPEAPVLPLSHPPVAIIQLHPEYQSEDDQSEAYNPLPTQRQVNGLVVVGSAGEQYSHQRDPDNYVPEYGTSAGKSRTLPSARLPPPAAAATERSAGSSKWKSKPLPSIDDSAELARMKSKNRSLKLALEDHAGRLELLKTDNDNLIQRLGDARKERERVDHELERERREFREKLRDLDKSRKVRQQLTITVQASILSSCYNLHLFV